jgi:hypothetical protein
MNTTTGTISRTDAVSLADEDAVKEVLIESVLGLWDVVNNLTRLKPSRKDRYRHHLRFGPRETRHCCL